jgi:hypothetical protein
MFRIRTVQIQIADILYSAVHEPPKWYLEMACEIRTINPVLVQFLQISAGWTNPVCCEFVIIENNPESIKFIV